MNIVLNKISEKEFESINLKILFNNKLTNRVFAILSNKYKFAWQSTNIEPIIKNINANTFFIGIDLSFVIFDFLTGEIFINIFLDYFFYDSIIFKEDIYVITELEIIQISKSEYKVLNIYQLSDYFESFSIKKNHLIVQSVDDNQLIIY